MNRSWTLGKRIAAGFALAFVLLAIIGAVAYRSIITLSQASYSVARSHVVLESLVNVVNLLQDAESAGRGYIITGDESFIAPHQQVGNEIAAAMNELRKLTADNSVQQKLIDQAEPVVAAKLSWVKRINDMRKAREIEQVTKLIQTGEGKKLMDDLQRILGEIEQAERNQLKQRAGEVEAAVNSSTVSITLGTLVCLLLVSAAGVTITRSLTSQIGAAVQHMQSSSSELQVASNQQVHGFQGTVHRDERDHDDDERTARDLETDRREFPTRGPHR